jgi:hypothetical protein
MQVTVDVAYAGPGRGHVVLAGRNMSRGDVLAAIPTDLCWITRQHGAVNESLEVHGGVCFWVLFARGQVMAGAKAFWEPSSHQYIS